MTADVGGDTLERHHRYGAGLLGDPRLLGVDDVHDDAAFEHLGQPSLDELGSTFHGHSFQTEMVVRYRASTDSYMPA